MLVSRGVKFHKFGEEKIVFPRQRRCPYCYPYDFPMKLEILNESERMWRCLNPEYSLIDSPFGGMHGIVQWRCGLCGRWGSENITEDKGVSTGHAHISCRDRELLHVTCSCGFDEFIPRGSGFGVIIAPQHSGKEHHLRVKRTFKLGGKKITTVMGREIKIEEQP